MLTASAARSSCWSRFVVGYSLRSSRLHFSFVDVKTLCRGMIWRYLHFTDRRTERRWREVIFSRWDSGSSAKLEPWFLTTPASLPPSTASSGKTRFKSGSDSRCRCCASEHARTFQSWQTVTVSNKAQHLGPSSWAGTSKSPGGTETVLLQSRCSSGRNAPALGGLSQLSGTGRRSSNLLCREECMKILRGSPPSSSLTFPSYLSLLGSCDFANLTDP